MKYNQMLFATILTASFMNTAMGASDPQTAEPLQSVRQRGQEYQQVLALSQQLNTPRIQGTIQIVQYINQQIAQVTPLIQRLEQIAVTLNQGIQQNQLIQERNAIWSQLGQPLLAVQQILQTQIVGTVFQQNLTAIYRELAAELAKDEQDQNKPLISQLRAEAERIWEIIRPVLLWNQVNLNRVNTRLADQTIGQTERAYLQNILQTARGVEQEREQIYETDPDAKEFKANVPKLIAAGLLPKNYVANTDPLKTAYQAQQKQQQMDKTKMRANIQKLEQKKAARQANLRVTNQGLATPGKKLSIKDRARMFSR